nr:PREDICTED: uncharacterized protein LOC107079506 [Lepisosteus oculatus]XP_015219628.1 PREDICTED: uncharacterized protein LOC107079506 [Lepisosteus oculatus]
MEMLTKSAEPITERKDEGSNTAKGNMATSVGEENIVSVKNGKVHVNPKIKKQDSKGSLLSTIGEEKTTWPMVMQPVASRKELDFGDKMTLFVDRVKGLKQQQCTALSDYYSERLQESLNSSKQKIRDVALQSAMEEEHGKWLLVGKEMDSRSITVKPLEWDFSQKDVSAEVLFLDSYSAVITKENREDRNWIDNNPHCTTFNVTSVNDQTPRDPRFT